MWRVGAHDNGCPTHQQSPQSGLSRFRPRALLLGVGCNGDEKRKGIMHKTIVIELKDESAEISGGNLAIGQGVCHFTPREPIRKDLLFYPYIDGIRVSAVLRLVPADWCVVFNNNLEGLA